LVKALGDRRANIRTEAARTLGELRVSAPSVLKGLAAALRDSDPHVVFEAVKALGDIGAPSPDVIAGLVNLLGNANSLFCGWAIFALQSIGSFDQSVHNAVRQVATGTFSFPAKQPSGYGDDYEYWCQSYEDAERHHKENRQLAVELLSRIPAEPMVQEAMGIDDAATHSQRGGPTNPHMVQRCGPDGISDTAPASLVPCASGS
jgi:hypothetical protein